MSHTDNKSASGEFARLDGLRQGYLCRTETAFARYTLPRVCPPDNYDANRDALQNDWQAVGAQVVNHLTNRLMLTMFAPSRPFIRLEVPPAELAKIAAALGQDPSLQMEKMLAAKEQEASKELDVRGVRPQIHEALTNLVVIGDTLAHLTDTIEVYNIRDYVVARTPRGTVSTAIIKTAYCFQDLTPEAQEIIKARRPAIRGDDPVTYYRWLKKSGEKMTMTTWVDDLKLPEEFDDSWPVDDCPWKFWVWNLRRKQHYGTGLVEEYNGDFAALSVLSKAQLDAAIQASEFRWLVNPAGQTNADDFEDSENGAVIPGIPEDVNAVSAGKGQDLQTIRSVHEDYVRRIGRGFLLGSAMTRDSERTTATEIQMMAQELETGLGGAYSRLAGGPQKDIGKWLLSAVDLDIKGTKIRMAVITGLDALSRNGDLSALRAALSDIGAIGTLPPQILAFVKLDAIVSTIFLGHGLAPDKYVKGEEQVQQEQAAAQQADTTQQATVAGAQAGAQVAARDQTRQTQ
jgi:hypothetical protein